MDPHAQSEHETCHLILLRHKEPQLLLRKTDTGFMLPSVEIPRWERLAENLTAAVNKEFGCEAVCLLSCANSTETTPQERRFEVMEVSNTLAVVEGTMWQSIDSPMKDSFEDNADFKAIERCLHELDKHERAPNSPFARRGWFDGLKDWVAQAIGPLGLELTGSFQQYNASPTFNLTRFETTGPAVWFKAVGEPNLREFPITLKLAERLPRFVPKVLGTKPEWNGWLSREANGKNLGAREVALWERAASELASLQVESIPESESLSRLGAHDLRFDTLLDAIDPFFGVIAELMDRQTKTPPARLNREELSVLSVKVDDAITLLRELEIPDTLGHLDLNPWNVVVSHDRCTFLDWAEAYVGCPFFSLEYLLQHFRRESKASGDCERNIVDAYLAPWRQLHSGDCIERALSLAPLGAVFAFAVGTGTWNDEEKLRDPKIAGYFRSLARRMNREAVQLMERRSPCLA